MDWEFSFTQLVGTLISQLHDSEQALIELNGESSQFTRFNQGRVRQTGQVIDGNLRLTLMEKGRTCDRTIPFTGEKDIDWPTLAAALADAREELPQLPTDPYQILPSGVSTSREHFTGTLLPATAIADAVLSPLGNQDFAGLYAGGTCVRAYADSAGSLHWFSTETYSLDYSLFTEDGKAVKGVVAGNHWQPQAYQQQLHSCKAFLDLMQRPAKALPRGKYRTYLAPAAVADLISMLSWAGISEAALRRSGGALRALQQGERRWSEKFNLWENFQRGTVPRFNRWGEIAPSELPLIHSGKLVNTLVSSRTAKEYGISSNYADVGESLRSPEIAPGNLAETDVLKQLGTGLYLSNLHYLNWSDRPQGCVTGMTRYACFWVENGEIVAPIKNLRFDESLYRCFGDCLVDLTDQVACIPEVGTYGHRDLGATWAPGMLVEDFTFTL